MKLVGKILVAISMAFSFGVGAPFSLDTAHSEVGFSVKHLMVSNVKGKFNSFDTNIDFDTKTKVFKALSATIDASSIDTNNDRRDDHLRDPDFFDTKKFPEIKFVMTSYEKDGDDEGKMKGDLTIKDVTKSVTLDVEIGGVGKGFKGETVMGFSLEGKISRKDFGLTWNRALEAGGVAVGDKVKMLIEIEAKQK